MWLHARQQVAAGTAGASRWHFQLQFPPRTQLMRSPALYQALHSGSDRAPPLRVACRRFVGWAPLCTASKTLRRWAGSTPRRLVRPRCRPPAAASQSFHGPVAAKPRGAMLLAGQLNSAPTLLAALSPASPPFCPRSAPQGRRHLHHHVHLRHHGDAQGKGTLRPGVQGQTDQGQAGHMMARVYAWYVHPNVTSQPGVAMQPVK